MKSFYKAQGDTIDKLVVDFACRRARAGLHYIALSRVRNLSDLYIRNFNESKIKTSNKVLSEMDHLRRQLIKLCLDFLYNFQCTTFKILFHNVRSLHLHTNDIHSDFNVKAADIAIFVETGLIKKDTRDQYSIAIFKHICRFDAVSALPARSKYGTIIYSEIAFQETCCKRYISQDSIEIVIIKMNQPLQNLQIISIYCSINKASLKELTNAFSCTHTYIDPHSPTIIAAYFNMDLLQDSSERWQLQSLLIHTFGYHQIINRYTTDYRSQFDHLYTNISPSSYCSNVLESHFSDHRSLFIVLKQC